MTRGKPYSRKLLLWNDCTVQLQWEMTTLWNLMSQRRKIFVFNNGKSSSDSTSHDEVRKCLEYSDNNLTSLKACSIVKRHFMKYNITLPSSAPVEHLFSHGGNLLTSSRNRMSDDHTGQVLQLRYNKQHCPSDLTYDDWCVVWTL